MLCVQFSHDHISCQCSLDMSWRSKSVRGTIDELCYGRDETVPCGKVATSVFFSVYLWASSFCLRNAVGRHSFVSAKPVTLIPV